MAPIHLPTPSQTIGPFFAVLQPWTPQPETPQPETPQPGTSLPGTLLPDGGTFWLRGALYDGLFDAVQDGLLEIWDASSGHFDRCATDSAGQFKFRIAKPRALPGQAPHLAMSVFARGLLDRVVTRVYFPDEPGNATDPVLSAIPDTAVRETLVARSGDGGYRFDIHLQGAHETVFFDLV